MLNVKVLGGKELIAALDPARAYDVLVKSLRTAATLVMRAAKTNAGGKVLKRRSGNLASSVTQLVDEHNLTAHIGVPGKGGYTPGGQADVGLYGLVNEEGAVIRPLPPNKWLKFIWAPRGQRVTKGGKGGQHWVSVRKVVIPKRPWLRPAYEDNAARIVETFRAGLERGLPR